MSFFTSLLAEPVKADMVAQLNKFNNFLIFLYEGLNSCPHSDIQCASSIAIWFILAWLILFKKSLFINFSGEQ